jgi:hypothetical protein
MATPGRSPRELVAQLIAHGEQDEKSPKSDVGAVTSAFQRVSEELTRWVGADGCNAVVNRALSRAQASHPALATVTIPNHSPPALEGVPEAIKAHSAPAMAAGLESMLVTLFELLGRLIGDDLSVKLAEQSRSGVTTTAEPTSDEGTEP